MTTRLHLTANFHFIKSCNFRCHYCFATFNDSPGRAVLPDEQLFELTRVLARRYSKVTLVGGEPTLYRRLSELLAACRDEGALTNIVTNGSRIDAAWLQANAGVLDFLTLSIDSGNSATHAALGRANQRGLALPTEHYRTLARAAHDLDMAVKINTVVTNENVDEDMSGLVRELAPTRWKILQAAPVTGQNDENIGRLTPMRADFDSYVLRHQLALADSPIRIVDEPIEMIRGSYIMVDPQGRFFDSTAGRHHYSEPILEVGMDQAFSQIEFDDRKFYGRGGDADLTIADAR